MRLVSKVSGPPRAATSLVFLMLIHFTSATSSLSIRDRFMRSLPRSAVGEARSLRGREGSASSCKNVTVSFDTDGDGKPLAAGTYVEAEWSNFGFKVSASGGEGDLPRLLDTNNPGSEGTCGDSDLGAPNEACSPTGPGIGNGGAPGSDGENCEPLGNVMIVQDPTADCPDDNVEGGMIVFDFDSFEPAEFVYSMAFLDIDKETTVTVIYEDGMGKTQAMDFELLLLGDNSKQKVDINMALVKVIAVSFTGSGSIVDIVICYKEADAESPAASPVVSTTSLPTGDLPYRSTPVSPTQPWTSSPTTLSTPNPTQSRSESPTGSPIDSRTGSPSTSKTIPPTSFITTLSPTAGPTQSSPDLPTTRPCKNVSVTFDTDADGNSLDAGRYVENEWTKFGFNLRASGGEGDLPRLFDTSNPGNAGTCGDNDLGAPNEECSPAGPGVGSGGAPGSDGENCEPLGNILIIQEPGAECPDDNGDGGVIVFEFFEPAAFVYSMTFLDTETETSVTVTYQDDNGQSQIEVFELLLFTDNYKQKLAINLPFVEEIQVNFTSSGSIVDIDLCHNDPEPDSSPTTSATASPTTLPTLRTPSNSPTNVPTRSPSFSFSSPPTSSPTSLPLLSETMPPSQAPTGASPTDPKGPGKNVTVSFDSDAEGNPLEAGAYVETEWTKFGFRLSASGGEGDLPRLFDTSNPGSASTCGDNDLGAPNEACSPPGPGKGSGGAPGSDGENCEPLGNILIVQEPNADCPDDNGDGGVIEFQFFEPAEFVYSMTFLDIETETSVTVTYQDNGQLQTEFFELLLFTDNYKQKLEINLPLVEKVTVNFTSSGSIVEIDLCYNEPKLSSPVDSPTISTTALPTRSPSFSPKSASTSFPSSSLTSLPIAVETESPTNEPIQSSQSAPDLSPTKDSCKNVTVSFDSDADGNILEAGEYVETEWTKFGFKLSASGGEGDFPRLFDTSNPGSAGTCGDNDLGAPNEACSPPGPGKGNGGAPGSDGENCEPLGNILIVQEPNEDCPDDNGDGGMIVFEFLEPAGFVYSMTFLDTETETSVTVTYQDDSGESQIKVFELLLFTDNYKQKLEISLPAVEEIKVNFTSSGSIVDIAFCYNDPTMTSSKILPSDSAPTPVAATSRPTSMPQTNRPTSRATTSSTGMPTRWPTFVSGGGPPAGAGAGNDCNLVTVNFDKDMEGNIIQAGTTVSNEWESLGLTLSAVGGVGNLPYIVDSSNPGNATCGDPDLGSPNEACSGGGPGKGIDGAPGKPGENCVPVGNVLIVQEPGSDCPDDNVNGGIITLDFGKSGRTYVKDVTLIDIDYRSILVVESSSDSGTELREIVLDELGDNSVQTVDIDQANVKSVKLQLARSGGVTQVSFCPCSS